MHELIVKSAWIALALVHLPPASVLFAPTLVRSLYGVAPDGDAGVLLVHRGALFLALVITGIWAAFAPAVRPLAAAAMAVSVVGFLVVYARAGMPAGSLRIIAAFDLVALLPLAVVSLAVWRGVAGAR